jgi:hypothetical protein
MLMRHILMRERSIADFTHTMRHIESALKEKSQQVKPLAAP